MHSRLKVKLSFMISAKVQRPYDRFFSECLIMASSLVLRATSNLLMSQQRPLTICSKHSSRFFWPYYKKRKIYDSLLYICMFICIHEVFYWKVRERKVRNIHSQMEMNIDKLQEVTECPKCQLHQKTCCFSIIQIR